MKEPTYKFTWKHSDGIGQASGTDKKYMQSQAKQFRQMGFKVSRVVEVEQNKHKRDK